MIIKLLVYLIFYGLLLLLSVYSLVMIYVLFRYGKSKILGTILSAFYLLVILSLYAAAEANLSMIPIPQT
ncbi:MAG: hypothetical protein UY65_C0002G0015 [Parcubacteria group bacterium GW2011_GWA2_51_12]|nr:MAG: hypothetical protein UY65_C0002G0015 [Parcubacteria group bacterium GW2011_GWA2_51_12]